MIRIWKIGLYFAVQAFVLERMTKGTAGDAEDMHTGELAHSGAVLSHGCT
jgi:hypothetical protein